MIAFFLLALLWIAVEISHARHPWIVLNSLILITLVLIQLSRLRMDSPLGQYFYFLLQAILCAQAMFVVIVMLDDNLTYLFAKLDSRSPQLLSVFPSNTANLSIVSQYEGKYF